MRYEHINEVASKAVDYGASDLHITVGAPPIVRVNGELKHMEREVLTSEDTKKYVYQLLNKRQVGVFEELGEVDFSHTISGKGRFRVNAYLQRNSHGLAMRTINADVPTADQLGLPEIIRDLARRPRGLILVTGPTGSGKSTTLAAMIDQINNERSCHIMTLEDPIEYTYKHKRSIVNQREIGQDSMSFGNALRASLRQDPDVILVGEMRDLDTISIAITAAETGHLVLSTLHTLGASKTIDRIIDVFPPHQQAQVKTQLSTVFEGVISQQLLPRIDKVGRLAAHEIMVGTPAIKNLIREGKTYQIDSSIQTGGRFGMQTMDTTLIEIYREGKISKETLMASVFNKENVIRAING